MKLFFYASIGLLLLSVNSLFAQSVLTIQDAAKVRRIKMDTTINSSYYEGSPLLSPDGKNLYIYRTGHPQNLGMKVSKKDEDIWFSTKTKAGTWTNMKNIGSPLNGKNNSAVCGVSPDGNILYLHDFYTTLDITGRALSNKRANGWSTPKHINTDNFYMLNYILWLYVSSDGQILLMSLQRAETEGMSDLYVSFLQSNGSFSVPKNLGSTVNSRLNEASPFLAADNKTLYYASEGKPGYGNMDIFVTRRLDDSWQNWSEPENLGPNVNTNQWDTELSISADGKECYMISGGQNYGDNSDVYKIELPLSARPYQTRLIYGYVSDNKTGKPLQGDIRLYNANDKEIGNALPDAVIGYYKIYLSDTTTYLLRAEKEGYFGVIERIEFNASARDSLRKDLQLIPIQRGSKVNLRNIYFEQSKYELKNESAPQLNEIKKIMTENVRMKIKITGHTDNVGNPIDNQKLSQDRANEVKKYLTNAGIEERRIITDGKGGTAPVAPNDSEKNRQQNRRVEFEILEL